MSTRNQEKRLGEDVIFSRIDKLSVGRRGGDNKLRFDRNIYFLATYTTANQNLISLRHKSTLTVLVCRETLHRYIKPITMISPH